jgi:HAD superfamily hydrolase (TIGR01509 family)
MAPRALVFDCDGTLVDTMPAHYASWRAALDPHEIPFRIETFYALGGVPTRDIVVMLASQTGSRIDVDAVAAAKEADYERRLDEVPGIPQVVEIARAARGQLPMAVATGSIRRTAERTLRGAGLDGWFDVLVTAEDVTRPKPAPDIFLLAAERLGIAPTACRAYEDTDLGCESARRAGMEVIDVRELLAR